MKKILKIGGVIVLVLILIGLVMSAFARQAPPPQLVANFTQLDKIESISKYRSCAGHNTVPQDESESRRNMKHYFKVKPQFLSDHEVEIYAPFDGFVAGTRSDRAEGLEGEIWLAPKDIFVMLPPTGRWTFSVQHINIRDGLKRGKGVKAGELLGYGAVSATNERDTFDIVSAKSAMRPKMIDNWSGPFTALDSVFNQMSDSVWAEYQAKGINSKSAIIMSKAERDQNPCTYKDNGPYFLNQDDASNWVTLPN